MRNRQKFLKTTKAHQFINFYMHLSAELSLRLQSCLKVRFLLATLYITRKTKPQITRHSIISSQHTPYTVHIPIVTWLMGDGPHAPRLCARALFAFTGARPQEAGPAQTARFRCVPVYCQLPRCGGLMI